MAIVLLFSPGCSKEELKQKFDQAKQKTQELADSTVAAIEEKLPETGSVTLSSSPEIPAAKFASIELISVGDGRPNVVQILTYDPSSSRKSYPAILISGPVDVKSASALSGKQVDCDLYLQTTADAPISMTGPGESVSVTFGAIDAANNTLIATIDSVQLVSSDDKPVKIGGGNFVAVIRSDAQ